MCSVRGARRLDHTLGKEKEKTEIHFLKPVPSLNGILTAPARAPPPLPSHPRFSMSEGDSHLAAAAAAAMAADSHHSNGAGHRVHVAGEAAARTLAHAFHAGGSAPPAGGNGMDALRKSTCAPQLCHVNPTSPSPLQCCRSRARSLSLWSFRVLVALPDPSPPTLRFFTVL